MGTTFSFPVSSAWLSSSIGFSVFPLLALVFTGASFLAFLLAPRLLSSDECLSSSSSSLSFSSSCIRSLVDLLTSLVFEITGSSLLFSLFCPGKSCCAGLSLVAPSSAELVVGVIKELHPLSFSSSLSVSMSASFTFVAPLVLVLRVPTAFLYSFVTCLRIYSVDILFKWFIAFGCMKAH